MTLPFAIELERAARENHHFRHVVFTGDRSQVVVMSVAPGEEIGAEIHGVEQLLFGVEGIGEVVVEGASRERFGRGMMVCVPAGCEHNVINKGTVPLQLISLYAPPQHAPGTVHRTKADARAEELAQTIG